MKPVVTDRVAWSVRPSVCRFVTVMSPAKTAEPIEIPFVLWAQLGLRNHVLDGSRSPMGTGNFERELAVHCKVLSCENG